MSNEEFVTISRAYEDPELLDNGRIECGSGPELASARVSENPNWIRSRAANLIAIAEWIEGAAERNALDNEVRALREAAGVPDLCDWVAVARKAREIHGGSK